MSFMGSAALRTAVLQSAGDPSLKLHYDFAGRKSLVPVRGPAITFTRASAGGVINASQVWESLGNDVPRFDHDLATGASLGLLKEKAATWLALWNRDHTNAVWVASNMTQVKDATGLDGVANSATTLTATGANATSLQTITVASAEFTRSIYVKRVTGSGDIDITDNNGTNWTTLTGLSSTEWTRHDITRTQANPVIGVRIVTDTDAIEVDFEGLEAGSLATSAVEVTSSTVTRAVDLFGIVGASEFFGVGVGTFFLDTYELTTAQTRSYINIDDGSGANQIESFATNPTFNIILDISSVRQVSMAQGTIGTGGFKMAFAWAEDDAALAMDGVIKDTDTDTGGNVLPSTVGEIDFGHTGSSPNVEQVWYRQFKLFNVRKPNSLLTSITQ